MTAPQNNSLQDLLKTAKALVASGSIDDALAACKEADAAALGYYLIAEEELSQGRRDGMRTWMEKVEALAAADDVQANFLCWLTWESGMGEDSYDWDETHTRSNAYLKRAAELGHPSSQLNYALYKLGGNNGMAIDIDEYHHWIAKAIDVDLDEAVLWCCENAVRHHWDVEDRVLSKLRNLAPESRKARKLLNRLIRRPRVHSSEGIG